MKKTVIIACLEPVDRFELAKGFIRDSIKEDVGFILTPSDDQIQMYYTNAIEFAGKEMLRRGIYENFTLEIMSYCRLSIDYVVMQHTTELRHFIKMSVANAKSELITRCKEMDYLQNTTDEAFIISRKRLMIERILQSVMTKYAISGKHKDIGTLTDYISTAVMKLEVCKFN